MSIVSRIKSWFHPTANPEDQLDSEEVRAELESERIEEERRERKRGGVSSASPAGGYTPVYEPKGQRTEFPDE